MRSTREQPSGSSCLQRRRPASRYEKYLVAAAPAVWMLMIFCMSAVHGSDLGPNAPALNLAKKAGHFFLFGVLAVLFYTLLRNGRLRRETLFPLLVSFVLSVVYAALDEFHQSFIPGRHPSLRDVLIDASGAFTFLCILLFIKKRTVRA